MHNGSANLEMLNLDQTLLVAVERAPELQRTAWEHLRCGLLDRNRVLLQSVQCG